MAKSAPPLTTPHPRFPGLQVPVAISPGSEQIRATIERDGLIEIFEKVGAAAQRLFCRARGEGAARGSLA